MGRGQPGSDAEMKQPICAHPACTNPATARCDKCGKLHCATHYRVEKAITDGSPYNVCFTCGAPPPRIEAAKVPSKVLEFLNGPGLFVLGAAIGAIYGFVNGGPPQALMDAIIGLALAFIVGRLLLS